MKTLNYYEENAESLIHQYENANVTELQNLLLDTFHKKSIILEIGSGSGRDASFMLKNDFNIITIEGSKKMIDESIKIHPELKSKVLHKTLPNDLKFDNKFDGIYSISTLMHLSKSDIEKTITKIYNLLNENGLFLMSVSLYRDDIDENGFDDKSRFFLILEYEEWIEILKKIGFTIVQTKSNNDGLKRSGIEWLTLVVKK